MEPSMPIKNRFKSVKYSQTVLSVSPDRAFVLLKRASAPRAPATRVRILHQSVFLTHTCMITHDRCTHQHTFSTQQAARVTDEITCVWGNAVGRSSLQDHHLISAPYYDIKQGFVSVLNQSTFSHRGHVRTTTCWCRRTSIQ